MIVAHTDKTGITSSESETHQGWCKTNDVASAGGEDNEARISASLLHVPGALRLALAPRLLLGQPLQRAERPCPKSRRRHTRVRVVLSALEQLFDLMVLGPQSGYSNRDSYVHAQHMHRQTSAVHIQHIVGGTRSGNQPWRRQHPCVTI